MAVREAPVVGLPQAGGCLCGAVRYALTAAPLLAYACHCHGCQTRSGAAFTLTLVARSADVEVTGPMAFTDRATPSGRQVEHGACGLCGTALIARARVAADYVSLRAGTLDDAGWVRPVVQTCVESAIPWAVIAGVPTLSWSEFDFEAAGRAWVAQAPRFAPRSAADLTR